MFAGFSWEPMAYIAFVISNNRHHPAMVLPVVERLSQEHDRVCEVISLCEFRGQPSPATDFRHQGAKLVKVLPFNVRTGPVARGVAASKRNSPRHHFLQTLLWHVGLGPRLRYLLSPAPTLAVLPNDSAFPFDRLVRLLAERHTPFLLLQEGIRFPLPGVPHRLAYGSGGAAAVAAWGESSAAYFREVGVEPQRIHLTGNPRLDGLDQETGGSSARRSISRNRRGQTILLATNPIDEQGFCTLAEKLAMVRRFVDEIAELVREREIRLCLKLHASESRADYERALAGSSCAREVTFAGDAPLHALLASADAAVIMASTVGLEALLLGTPVGVLELPRVGFVFDYVADKAAQGLNWSRPMAPQVRELLDYDSPGAHSFLKKHLHQPTVGSATEAVTRLVVELAGPLP